MERVLFGSGQGKHAAGVAGIESAQELVFFGNADAGEDLPALQDGLSIRIRSAPVRDLSILFLSTDPFSSSANLIMTLARSRMGRRQSLLKKKLR